MIGILFNPVFLAIIGSVLLLLKLTGAIHLNWFFVVLPFVIRPLTIFVTKQLMKVFVSVATNNWRKNPKIGDVCRIIPKTDKLTELVYGGVTVTNVYDDGTVELKRKIGGAIETRRVNELEPLFSYEYRSKYIDNMEIFS